MPCGRPPSKQATPLGQRIARARLQAGLSQSELARKLGVGRTNLAQWERSAVTVKPDPLCALADSLAGELDVSVDEVLGVRLPPPETHHRQGPFAGGLQRRRHQQKIVEVVQALLETG